LAEVRVGADARPGGVDILAVVMKRDESVASKKPLVREMTVTLKDKKDLKALNPWGTGMQIDYPFLGFSQAMADPELFEELAQILRELKVKLIRFPGGNSAYFYSIHGQESFGPLKELTGYWMLDPEKYKWADTRDLLRLCKAIDADCVYQLNLGNWYDPKTKKAYRIAVQDKGLIWPVPKDADLPLQGSVQPLEYHCEKLKDAAEDAKTIVGWAKEAGVKTIWEFGNEDTVYFSPKVHVDVCKAFYDAIREADPKAQFMIYGDGYSWSDWRWPFAVFEEMAKQKLDIAYTSHHVYIFGGTGIPFDNGQHAYDGIVAGWHNIRELHAGVRGKLNGVGYQNTQPAMTEGNMAAAGPLVGSVHEHGMGRALGEAQTFISRISKYAMWIYHDLVHNGSCEADGSGGWYARVYYHPENPKGQRYSLPLDSKVMSIVNEHALRDVILDDAGVTASQWDDGVLLTAGNPLAIPKKIRVKFDGKELSADATEVICFRTMNLDTPKYATKKRTLTPHEEKDGAVVEMTLPPYSFSYVRLKANGTVAK
jgi:alpha-L-arabinofuranosidase